MTNINEFNISKEELEEIQEITELAQGCTDYLLESLVNSVTNEKVKLSEEEKKSIFKTVLDKTMEFIDENSFPDNEEMFSKYVECIFKYVIEELS